MTRPTKPPTANRPSADVVKQFDEYVIPNYRRLPMSLVRGEGSYVWDAEGKRYLDLFPGWGCNTLGYSPPRLVRAIQKQVEQLIHVPNTWYTEPQGDFAEALCTRGFGKAFFCNSGAEAIEGAIKLARLHTPAGKYKVISFLNGFHGRTYAAVTATAQPKYHTGITPLLPGFMYAPFNDLDAVAKLIDDETCALLIEPVQGEGGVNIATDDFLQGLRALADEHGLVLIFDEVQTGVGRLGQWFGYQVSGVQPDVMTLAKGLAGGVACGAIIARDELAPSLKPGMHASTFGGNPLAMAAGLATIATIEEDNLLENIAEQSQRFSEQLTNLRDALPLITDLRIRGMMIGIELAIPSAPAVAACMKRGLLVNSTHDTVLRLLPPYNITSEQVDEGCSIIADVLKSGLEA